jgi:hypothetical protein
MDSNEIIISFKVSAEIFSDVENARSIHVEPESADDWEIIVGLSNFKNEQ